MLYKFFVAVVLSTLFTWQVWGAVEIERVVVSGVCRAWKYYDSASHVVRIDIHHDAAVADYGEAATVGSVAWALKLFDDSKIGGKIFIHAGTYNILQPLKIVPRVHVEGAGITDNGSGTIIKISDNFNTVGPRNCFEWDKSASTREYFFKLSNICLEGNKNYAWANIKGVAGDWTHTANNIWTRDVSAWCDDYWVDAISYYPHTNYKGTTVARTHVVFNGGATNNPGTFDTSPESAYDYYSEAYSKTLYVYSSDGNGTAGEATDNPATVYSAIDLFWQGSGVATYTNGAQAFVDLHIRDVFIENFPLHGVAVRSGWGFIISGSVIEFNNGFGIAALGDTSAIITHNKTLENGIGIFVNAGNTRVLGNEVGTNEGEGIYVNSNGEKTLISGNNIYSNVRNQGSWAFDSALNTYNSASEVFINDHQCMVMENSISSAMPTATYGVRVYEATTENQIINNGFPGGTPGAVVTKNIIYVMPHANTRAFVSGNTPAKTWNTDTVTLYPFGENYLNTATVDVSATLPDGMYIGQEVKIILTDATAAADGGTTVSVTHHETSDPEVGTFTAVGMMWHLMWNGVDWVTIKATCTL